MELHNPTPLAAASAVVTQPDGRPVLVAVVRGTFRLSPGGGTLHLAAQQMPPAIADISSGEGAEHGRGVPRYEHDFAPGKRACDLIIHAHAHAPGGQPAARVAVGVACGPLRRIFAVCGERRWQHAGDGSLQPSAAEPFVERGCDYTVAFGGADPAADGEPPAFCAQNPLGRGYCAPGRDPLRLLDQLLPATEDWERPITAPGELLAPLALGPLGRGWAPRVALAGTYDETWRREVFPLPPRDFDVGYHQCAPPEQQMPYPQGGEEIQLLNLTPAGRYRCLLPRIAVELNLRPARGSRELRRALIDTIAIDTVAGTLSLVWRVCQPLARGAGDIAELTVDCRGELLEPQP
ncbi:DUF2169 family type VI secretion system accessory protein [Plasticicumulans acidivorans]|uniref:DUF2169 domain-containing protein n=1 Tax=Plasticicumulans acidivorans TaxID=886464 RepID=A0A317MYK7_9GAMM|nr:DUF2169 domain-containing protein [Plasticicumulans acidivorans]PWV64769.1 hypothetical protein C7443_102422 [Plasticicumulans acidivorans]